jgi:hypothetical protein
MTFAPFVLFRPKAQTSTDTTGLGVALKSPEKLKILGTVFEVPPCMTATTV